MNKVAVILLAAGESRRFGAPKQTALYRGQTFIDRQLDTISGVPDVDCYAVIGAHIDPVKRALRSRTVPVIENERWQEGMSSSIKAAVRYVSDQYEKVAFLAVDQILLESRHLSELIALGAQYPDNIIACRYDASLFGIPVLFPRAFYAQLLSLTGDAGAKNIVSKNMAATVFYDCPAASVDIDTPNQLQRL